MVFISFSFCFFPACSVFRSHRFLFFQKSCLTFHSYWHQAVWDPDVFLPLQCKSASHSICPCLRLLPYSLHNILSNSISETPYSLQNQSELLYHKNPFSRLTWDHSVSSQSLSIIASFRFSRQLISLVDSRCSKC